MKHEKLYITLIPSISSTRPTEIYFASAGKFFLFIEDAGVSVIVCWKDCMDLVDQVLHSGPSYMLMKKLAQYTVNNIYQSDFKKLLDMGVVSEKKEGLFVVEYQQQYDPQLGIAYRQQLDYGIVNHITKTQIW